MATQTYVVFAALLIACGVSWYYQNQQAQKLNQQMIQSAEACEQYCQYQLNSTYQINNPGLTRCYTACEDEFPYTLP